MSSNANNPNDVISMMYDHFPTIKETAITHLAKDADGSDLYLMLFRDVPGANGAMEATNGTPTASNESASGDAAEPPTDAEVSLRDRIAGLLQTNNPTLWSGCQDKQHCGGPSHIIDPTRRIPIRRHVKHADNGIQQLLQHLSNASAASLH